MNLKNQINLPEYDVNILFIQRYLNNNYGHEFDPSIECDGIYKENLNDLFIYALQRIEGFPPYTCNKIIIENVKNRLPILLPNEKNQFVELLQFALYCNGYKNIKFTGIFDVLTQNAVLDFNILNKLSDTRIAIPNFWELLLKNKSI
ncbi:MAG: peptidoglycan-binding domain-containing protein [Sarcina sp.]